MEEGPITLALLDELMSPAGRSALAELATADLAPDKVLTQLETLRRAFPPEIAGALLATAQLRRRAAPKFPTADRMWFTAAGLEQATAWVVARRHAQQLDRLAPPGPVLDLGCGIGGDTLALAQHRTVIAYEQDPLRLRLAQANAQALGVAAQIDFRLADWRNEQAAGRLPEAAAAFADPSRREQGRRIFSPEAMDPPLSTLVALAEEVPVLAVKSMPGIADDEIPAGWSVEFVGHHGQCKEALLWHGLAEPCRWATVHVAHPAGDEGVWHELAADAAPPPIGPLAAPCVLHEPHPAVIRAGAFGPLCSALAAHLFDAQIAYLVGTESTSHPLVQSFAIDEIHPFSLKTLNWRLQALAVERVELKKRGFPTEPETLRPRLRLTRGSGVDRTIFFTRRGQERLLLLGRRLPAVERESTESVKE